MILTPDQKNILLARLNQPDCINLSDQDSTTLLNIPEPQSGSSWANTWQPNVEFFIPNHDIPQATYSVINHIVVEMIQEARS